MAALKKSSEAHLLRNNGIECFKCLIIKLIFLTTQLNDPCTHLWCSHQQSPDICKTKKGPPMDGTECGKGLWCVSGYCESMEKRRTNKDGLRHNPRAGGWGPWASWGDCSRTCGTGVQFRSRQCDNPRPAYGGSPCLGDGEDFRLCNIESCPASVDFRALQCKHLFEGKLLPNYKLYQASPCYFFTSDKF